MKDEIVEILKQKELEMDQVLDDAKRQAAEILAEANEKARQTRNSLAADSEKEIAKLELFEDEKLKNEIDELNKKSEQQINSIEDSYKQNRNEAMEHAVNRILEVILDKEND